MTLENDELIRASIRQLTLALHSDVGLVFEGASLADRNLALSVQITAVRNKLDSVARTL